MSLVAEVDGEIVGHILLTKAKVGSKEVLALAPLAVAPKWHGKGVGSKLVLESHRIAKELGYMGIALLGDPNYYTRFGYLKSESFGITCPFEVPSEFYMAIELFENSLNDVEGTVKHSPAFKP